MSSKGTQFKPAYCIRATGRSGLAFGLWRAVTALPFPLLLLLGKGIGLAIYRFPSRRKTIAKRNIELCFPDLSAQSRTKSCCRANFISTGIAVMEVGIAWWWSKKRFAKLFQFEGLENLEAVKGRGVMLAGYSFHHPRDWQLRLFRSVLKWTVCIAPMAILSMIFYRPGAA